MSPRSCTLLVASCMITHNQIRAQHMSLFSHIRPWWRLLMVQRLYTGSVRRHAPGVDLRERLEQRHHAFARYVLESASSIAKTNTGPRKEGGRRKETARQAIPSIGGRLLHEASRLAAQSCEIPGSRWYSAGENDEWKQLGMETGSATHRWIQ